MATVRSVPSALVTDGVYYPDSDGKPVGETPVHIDNLTYIKWMLQVWLKDDPTAFVAGDIFVYYEESKPRRHVSPDILVVRGVAPDTPPERRRYLVWKEGKGPDFVIEVTSKSTRRVDLKTKMELYRDTLQVAEYFLFDPFNEYLKPQLQGYQLVRGRYEPIQPVSGRLPSQVLGLHLEVKGKWLHLFDPASGKWLLNPWGYLEEAERQRTERLQAEAEAKRQREEAERQRIERLQAEAETERLRLELEELRRRLPPS